MLKSGRITKKDKLQAQRTELTTYRRENQGLKTMEEEHHHSHHHHHHHDLELTESNKNIRNILYIGIFVNIFYVFVEVFCGWKFNSLGLISDAGHNLSDVLSLVLSLIATYLIMKKANHKYTYGFKKSTILIALLNAFILFVAVAGIVYESLERFSHPQPVDGFWVFVTAGIGIIVNGVTAFLLHRGKEDDLNVAGAFWHMFADTLVSVGVVISGIIIYYTDYYLIDSIISLIIAAVILFSSWEFLADSLRLALDGVPSNIDLEKLESSLKAVEGIEDIHHLHVWALSTRENSLTAHIVVAKGAERSHVKAEVRECLEHFNIKHSTLETEEIEEECGCEEDE